MDLNSVDNPVIVVEGYHDLARLREMDPSLDVVITNGSEISEETLSELELLNQQRGLVLFMDPDVPGERIRRLIQDRVGPTAHAYLTKEECISKNHKKIGVEHAALDDIKAALEHIKFSQTTSKSRLTMQDLFQLQLTGYPGSKQRRINVAEKLGIGLVNGKTLLRKLRMFGITKAELTHLLSR